MGRKPIQVILPLCWWRGPATSLAGRCTSSWGRWGRRANWWCRPSAWTPPLQCSYQGSKAWLYHRLLSLVKLLFVWWLDSRWRKSSLFPQWSRPWQALGIFKDILHWESMGEIFKPCDLVQVPVTTTEDKLQLHLGHGQQALHKEGSPSREKVLQKTVWLWMFVLYQHECVHHDLFWGTLRIWPRTSTPLQRR